MTKLKGSLLGRRPSRRPSRDSEAGRRLPEGGTQSIQSSILQTLRYSDHFGFPLTLKEIHLRLVGARFSRPSLIRTIKQMVQQNLIEQSGDYYYLPGHKYLVARRLKRAKLSAPQFALAHVLTDKISKISGIVAIYLTGSLALSNTEGKDDIDLMVITAPGRLWTTRFLLTLYTEFLGLRRRPKDRDPSGKLCLNLYLTPDSYFLPISKQNLYTAYELIQAVPLYDPADTHTSLLAANPWIHSYLPNAIIGSDLEGRAQPADSKAGRSDPKGLMKLIEFCFYYLQLLYMHGKITREYITSDSAFFHPNNPSP